MAKFFALAVLILTLSTTLTLGNTKEEYPTAKCAWFDFPRRATTNPLPHSLGRCFDNNSRGYTDIWTNDGSFQINMEPIVDNNPKDGGKPWLYVRVHAKTKWRAFDGKMTTKIGLSGSPPLVTIEETFMTAKGNTHISDPVPILDLDSVIKKYISPKYGRAEAVVVNVWAYPENKIHDSQ